MPLLPRLAAVFSVAAENVFRRDTLSPDRQAYHAFRKLGLALEKIESFSPPRDEQWMHPREGVKSWRDWSVSDILHDQQKPLGLTYRKNAAMDGLGMTLTLLVLTEAARKNEYAYRAEQNAWPVTECVTFLKNNLDKVDALTETVSRMGRADIETLKTRKRDENLARGCKPVPETAPGTTAPGP